MSALVLSYVPDLMLEPRIAAAVRRHGATLHALSGAADALALPASPPALVLVAFRGEEDENWVSLVHTVRQRWPEVPVVAFGPHVAVEARRRAREMGCIVLPRGRFLETLPSLLSAYLADDPTGCAEPPHPLLLEGVALFNRGEFYECHEVLEDAWRQDMRPCRHLYQGLLQLAVALYHVEQGNYAGALKVLGRARRHLARLPGRCQGVDVVSLRAHAEAIEERIRALGPAGIQTFPRHLFPVVDIQGSQGNGESSS